MPGLINFTLSPNSLSSIKLLPGTLVNIPSSNTSSSIADFSFFQFEREPVVNNDLKIETTTQIPEISFPEELATIQISRGVNELPTCTASFYKTSNTLTDALSKIKIGNNYTLMKIPFVLDSYTVTTYLSSSQRICQVNLSFVSKYAPRGSLTPLNPLDKPIQFNAETTKITWNNIDSKISTSVNLTSKYAKYYSGQSVVEITPRSELEAAFLLSSNHLIVYSENTIFGKSLNSSPVGTLYYQDFFEDVIQTSFTNYPFYERAELTLDEIPVPGRLEVTERLEFENATDLSNVVTPSNSPGDVEQLNEDMKNPGAVFDNGGRTKTVRRIWEKDGQPIRIEEKVYGYVFNMKEMLIMPESPIEYLESNWEWPLNFKLFAGNFAMTKWQIVQQTTTNYNYDKDGYLVNTVKQGWKFARLQRETGEYETATLVLKMYKNYHTVASRRKPMERQDEPPLAWRADAREYNSYTFFNPIDVSGDAPVFEPLGIFATNTLYQYPLLEKTSYYLDDLSNYYDDIQEEDVSVKPKFVYRSYSHNRTQEIAPNPKDDSNDPNAPYPPLLIFKENKELTTTQIVIPRSPDSKQKTPEIFSVSTHNHSSEGEFAAKSLMIGSSTQNLGRPSVHTRLNLNSVNFNNYPPNSNDILKYRYIVSGSIEGDSVLPGNSISRFSIGSSKFIPLSSLSFSGAATPDAGQVGAKNSLEREFLNSQQVTIHVSFNQFHTWLREGDIWNIEDDQGNISKWIIMNISYSLELVDDGKYICREGIELTIAPAQKASVSVFNRRR